MTGSESGYDDRLARDRAPEATPDEPTGSRDRTLKSVIVKYEDQPDRRTVFPRNCPDDRKLTAWLSADDNDFVDLHAVR
ncbi:DUF7511 domain-containing protein [Halopiger djelfimassiliensis]|uniref:DUF7511 domain-containing protein n=1 Tax=Halopiger djelfimassiliensis TaxID=1293047 RepID=UPI000677AD92|nr:hypothetical protein [Halopiger djelfimassiliensis]